MCGGLSHVAEHAIKTKGEKPYFSPYASSSAAEPFVEPSKLNRFGDNAQACYPRYEKGKQSDMADKTCVEHEDTKQRLGLALLMMATVISRGCWQRQ